MSYGCSGFIAKYFTPQHVDEQELERDIQRSKEDLAAEEEEEERACLV
jgi:hypothetical protein